MKKNITSNQFIKITKKIISNSDWFYVVIDFKNNSKYNNRYNDIEKISRDINSNLITRFNRIIRYYNKYLYSNGYESTLYKSIDDIFYNGIVVRELRYSDLSFIGVVEFSPLLSQKKHLNYELPEDLHLGTHLHLFIKNKTGLSSLKIMDEFQYQNKKSKNNWIENIKTVLPPKECNQDFYDTDRFIQYHLKQPFIEKKIIYNLERKKLIE